MVDGINLLINPTIKFENVCYPSEICPYLYENWTCPLNGKQKVKQSVSQSVINTQFAQKTDC